MTTTGLTLIRIWGDDSGRVAGGDPRLLLTRDPGVVLVVSDAGITWMDALTGRPAETAAWQTRPALTPATVVATTLAGDRVLVGTHQGDVILYDTSDGALVRSLARLRGAVTDVALSGDGGHCLAACDDGRVRVWSTGDGVLRAEVRGRAPASITRDGRRFTCVRGGVTVTEVDGGREQRVATAPTLRRARWSHDGALLWLFGELRGVECWRVDTDTRLASFERASTSETAACDRDGSLVMLDRRGEVNRFTRDAKLHTLASTVDESLYHAALSPDATQAAWLRHGSTLCVRDLATGREVHHHGEHAGSITALALSIDGSRAATASTDRLVRVWDVSSGETAWVLEGSASAPASVAFSPESTRVYASCAEGLVRAWSLADGQELDPVECEGAATIRTSPDGAQLVATHREGRHVSLVDLTHGRSRRLEGDDAFEYRAACFTGDGAEVVVLVTLDRTFVFRYDARTGRVAVPSSATVDRAMTELSRVSLGVPRYKPVVLSDDGATLAAETRARGQINLWATLGGEVTRTLPRPERPTDVLPMALGETLLVVPTRDRVEVWDHARAELVGELDLRPTHEHPVAVALSRDERTLLVGTSLARVRHYAIDR